MKQQNGGILSKKVLLDYFMGNKKKELLMRKIWFIIGMIFLIMPSIGLGMAFPGALLGLPLAAVLIIVFIRKRKQKLKQASSDMQALLDRGEMSLHKYRVQYAVAWEKGGYVCVGENEDGSTALLAISARPAFAVGKTVYIVQSSLYNSMFYQDYWTHSGREDCDDITYHLDFGKAERFRKKYCEMTSYSLYRRVCEGDNALYVISKDGKLQNNKHLFINALFTDELRKLICPDPDVVGQ